MLNDAVSAKVVRITSAHGQKYTLVRVTNVYGNVPKDPEGIFSWLRSQIGFSNCVLICPDGKTGNLLLGVEPEELKEFHPLGDLDWWEELISQR